MKKYLTLNKLIQVLRRSRTSMLASASYDEMFVYNKMLLNCYDVEQDSDIGSHMIIHIPDEWEDFYNGPFIIYPQEILSAITEGQKQLKEEREKRNLLPKAARIEAEYEVKSTGVFLTVIFAIDEWEKKPYTEISFKFTKKEKAVVEKVKEKYIRGEELYRFEKKFIFPYTDSSNPIIRNILNTYDKMLDRAVGEPTVIDGIEDALYDKITTTVGFQFYKIKVNDKPVSVPMIKSMFRGLKSFEELILSVTETNLKGIYLMSLQMTAKGLTESHIYYFNSIE